MLVKKQLLPLKAYDPGLTTDEIKNRYGLTKVYRLDANENPYGYSPKVTEALASHLEEAACYPDGASLKLRHALSERLKIKPESLLFGNGLDEVIQIISRAILTHGTNIVVAKETFPQYKLHAVIEEAGVKEVPAASGRHDLKNMLLQIDEETKIVWICNPNNPSGAYVNQTELINFMECVPEGTLVVIDEAYIDFVAASDYPDTLPLLEKYPNLIILRTFSKAYGLAGFRVGYAIGHPALIKQLEVTRLPFNTNHLGQIAALAALNDENYLKQCVDRNRKTIELISDFCDEHSLKYYPSQTNFIFIKIQHSKEIYEALLKKGYAIRPFPGGVRISMPAISNYQKLLLTIEDTLRTRRHQLSS